MMRTSMLPPSPGSDEGSLDGDAAAENDVDTTK